MQQQSATITTTATAAPFPVTTSGTVAVQQQPRRGFLASLSATLNGVVRQIERSVLRASEELTTAWNQATDQRFRRHFRVPFEERLLGEFWAQCISGVRHYSCSIYVSTNYLGFVVDIPGENAQVMIPLREIMNVQRAVALRSVGATPYFQPVNDPMVKADAIQIFTRDMKLHQFFNFLQFEKAYHAVMYAWRTALATPQLTTTIPATMGTTMTTTTMTAPVTSVTPAPVAAPVAYAPQAAYSTQAPAYSTPYPTQTNVSLGKPSPSPATYTSTTITTPAPAPLPPATAYTPYSPPQASQLYPPVPPAPAPGSNMSGNTMNNSNFL